MQLYQCCKYNCIIYTIIYTIMYIVYPTTRIPHSCSCSSSQKPSSVHISETESGIIDLLVSKRPKNTQIKISFGHGISMDVYYTIGRTVNDINNQFVLQLILNLFLISVLIDIIFTLTFFISTLVLTLFIDI